MNATAMRNPELERRKVRTALWLGLIAVGFALAFIAQVWLLR